MSPVAACRSHGLGRVLVGRLRYWRRSLYHTRKLMKADLHLKGGIAIFLIQRQVFLGDEWDLLIRGFGAQDIACPGLLV